ncbi:SGNH/GDSL hydrolase family protein [Agilicoccus flavus]|uniref:SGNH/GDSL hydrolase family protein n=1 Tax=Agilicoccus flavus TaxID=2775968 RepID=UPI001CF6CDA0|nr:SGNH/GDSL hydrolase family protein [Agilicoccus flavus]
MQVEGRRWQRYVALGDSFTEGLMDASADDPDSFVGWADLLAARLARRNTRAGLDFGYANLAVRGRVLADVAGPQLDAALDLAPDLVSISAGGNDLLRPRVSLAEVADGLEAAVARVRETGADVLMVTAPDIGWMPIVGRVNPRMAELTAHVWGIAQRHDCPVVDLWTLRELQDLRMWAPDRIHFSSRGHRVVADAAAWTLGLDDVEPLEALPPATPLTRLASMAANREWARTHLAPWVHRHMRGRSSGDGRSAKRPVVAPVDLGG